MKLEDIRTVSVFGVGLMGSGIAQVLALQGYEVYLRDITRELVDAGLENVKRSLQKATDKSVITSDQAEDAVARLVLTTDIAEAARTADFIIEAIPERTELKAQLFGQIDGLCRQSTILATNTSTLSITEIASATERPDRCIGMHFFNPVPQMKLVEIIRGLATADETVETTRLLVEKMGKDPIVVNDAPGFVTSRLGVALFLEASKILEAGIATPDAIDKGMRLGYGHRMGPFETVDLVGLDARLNNINALYESTRDPYWKPPQLLKKLVSAKYLGRKRGSKGGYYTYFGIE